jgi:hypothetical protein
VRVGFFFNHDQVHQVAHGLPIALALARENTGAEIIICTTNNRLSQEVRTLAGGAVGRNLRFVELELKRKAARAMNAVAGRLIPAAKFLMYRDNLDFFRSLDVLVVPEKTSLILKDYFHLDQLKIIHTRHGAGDRAIGFDKASARFDHVLAAGAKIRDRLVNTAGVSPEKISIVGYPKFDLFNIEMTTPRSNARTKVIYNPHVAPHLSSWYRLGPQILEWFAAHSEYDLIFAPHIMLFERRVAVTIQPARVARVGKVPKRLSNAPNIFVDTRSRALTTMEYLNSADIYIGDASSQAYEFMLRPRPCIFFDAHRFAWEGNPNFAHWDAGRVLTGVDELQSALAAAFNDHNRHFANVQRKLLRYTFDLSDTPSSVRAAQVIIDVAFARSSRRKANIASAARSDVLRELVPRAASATAA